MATREIASPDRQPRGDGWHPTDGAISFFETDVAGSGNTADDTVVANEPSARRRDGSRGPADQPDLGGIVTRPMQLTQHADRRLGERSPPTFPVTQCEDEASVPLGPS
jgi:hypothetical protein